MNAPDTDEHVHGAPYDHLGMRNNVEQYRTHLQHMFMQGTPHVQSTGYEELETDY